MKAAICVFPGSNCDRDMAVAIEETLGTKPAMVWHKETALPKADIVILPGGFSYGDYLRAGCMAAHSPIMKEVIAFARSGGAVLGVCNGFQILTEAGLLAGALIRNQSCKFICREVFIKMENNQTPFSSTYPMGSVHKIYIAHHDGNYQADASTLEQLEKDNLVVWRYCDAHGEINESTNPNGSMNSIAGLINKTGNVLGMMPHPERNADADLSSSLGGRLLFESIKQLCP
jgi:phosphoribosylformylglycinamidine synthase